MKIFDMSKKSNVIIQDLFLSNNINDDNEFIPIVTEEDDETGEGFVVPDILPILPLRNTVLFPGIVIPITVGREKSIKLIREAYKKDKIIGTVAQRNPNVNDPTGKDIFKVGTVAQVLKILEMPDNSTSVIIQGKRRFEINGINTDEPYLQAKVSLVKDIKPAKISKEFEEMAVKSAKAVGCKIAGVDILEGPDGPRIVDVNSQPGWKGLQVVAKVNIGEEIVNFVLK